MKLGKKRGLCTPASCNVALPLGRGKHMALPPGRAVNATRKHLTVVPWADWWSSLTFGSLRHREEQPCGFKMQQLWYERTRILALHIKWYLSSKICKLHPCWALSHNANRSLWVMAATEKSLNVCFWFYFLLNKIYKRLHDVSSLENSFEHSKAFQYSAFYLLKKEKWQIASFHLLSSPINFGNGEKYRSLLYTSMA